MPSLELVHHIDGFEFLVDDSFLALLVEVVCLATIKIQLVMNISSFVLTKAICRGMDLIMVHHKLICLLRTHYNMQ